MKINFSLEGKVAIVTGAARGNGKAIAEGLLEAGAIVYFVDILEQELEKGSESGHPRKKIITADLTKREELASIASTVCKAEGRIDILVNNAGITIGGEPSETYREEDWDSTLLVDLKVPFLLSQFVAKRMIEYAHGGSIINVTSLGAELGFSNNPAYVSAKGGLKQLTKALAQDWAQYNIRVNNLGPGYVHTDMTKKSFNDPLLKKERSEHMMLSRWAEPEDLAGPAVFLASEASGYITGQDLYVDGGWLAKGI